MNAPFPVAIVGVGNMGGAMAARLLDLAWPVRVCDIVEKRRQALAAQGAQAHALPADAVREAQVLIVCVVDAPQCEQVLFGEGGAASALPASATVILCPTLAPQQTESLALRLRAQHGLRVIDAPMSGGPARARDGSMSLMLAGEPQDLAVCEPLLQALAAHRFQVGSRIGDGARTKLVNNLAAGINLVAAAEVLAMAQRLGLDAARTLDVIERSSGQSWIGSDRMRRALAGDEVPRAHMTLLEKDTRLALQAAADAGFRGPLGGAAQQVFAQACEGGMADLDDGALLRWLTQRS